VFEVLLFPFVRLCIGPFTYSIDSPLSVDVLGTVPGDAKFLVPRPKDKIEDKSQLMFLRALSNVVWVKGKHPGS
jgi:hypothetical protein